MYDNKYKCLPQELSNFGYSLEHMGIYEMVWKSQEALKVIDFLSAKGYPILGGDVYSYNEKGIELTYDSWYINKTENESFVQESREKAFKYITEYAKNNGDNFLYCIVFDDVKKNRTMEKLYETD